MLDLWKSVLGLNNIGVTENFFQLGGDSILCIQLMTLARKSGILFDIKDIFENPTIQALAKSAKRQAKISSKKDTNTRNIPQESFSLAPIQEWFFERQLVNQNYFNQSFLLDINERLSTSLLNQGIVSLLNQHETLRIRFRKSDGKWTQYYANSPADQEWIDCIDLADDSFEKQNSEILKISQAKQAQLNIEKGPLFSLTLFELGQRKQKLLIIIHHLLIDGVSWRILLEDLEAICKTKHETAKDLILERTDLYMNWVESLRAYANSPTLKAEYPFWQKMVNQDIKALPIDHNLGIASVDNTLSISGQLSVEKTHSLLKDISSVYNTKINDILLAALALTITQWLGNDNIYISMEGHGRELVDKEIDTSRTLGWFTSIFPVLIHLDSKFDIGLSIQNTKKALQCIPENGVGYSIIKYLSEYGDKFKHAKQPEISFNYLGQWDNNVNKTSLFNFATEEHGNSNAIENRNLYLLNINSLVKNGQFQIAWKYSTNHFSSITIQELVDNYIKNLESIISHCLRRQVKYMIPLNYIGSLNPFFCIHPIDGDIHWLHEFATKLDSNRPFIAIENISLSYDLFDSIKKIETLAKFYIAEIKRVQPKGPYYIGGWSFGAVVAFEIAKLLESEGEEIENLILLDQYPIDPEVSGDIIKKIESDKDVEFKKVYQNSKKNFNNYIQNNLIVFEGIENSRYKHISSDNYQYMKANTSAYFLNRNLLREHSTTGKVKRITSILSKETYSKKSQILNPWEPFCDQYEQYVIDGDHNSIFQAPFVNKLLDILLKKVID
jgi:non-ribosomal peptide synthase protein (TIGR01720 family)